MPRANRYILPGCLYHLTHRCHDRKFLFRFGITREAYRERLRAALSDFKVSLLAYCITSNHTHLLVEAGQPNDISRMMQRLEGEIAEWYNIRKHRSGAFWEDRYHCTMVDGREYAWNCMLYIDLNMIRAGVVSHPAEWRWCGYDELAGQRQRYRLLDREAVLRSQGETSWEQLVTEYRTAIQRQLDQGDWKRNPIWTECLAVGGEKFTKRMASSIRNRIRLEQGQSEDGTWYVRDLLTPYTWFPGVKNRS